MNLQKLIQNHNILNQISRIANQFEMETYVVGGFVRDLILNRELKDIDIVVAGDGIAFAKKLAAELGIKKCVEFPKFRTAMMTIDHTQIEFVGARKESYHDRGTRKPEVEQGTLEEDLERRDFTINAMAIGLSGNRQGELIDPFNGRRHLDDAILTTPMSPKETFDDDPLRMVRGFRFAAQLGFSLDDQVLAAMEGLGDRLNIVSQERKTDEWLKILASPKPSLGFHLIKQAGLLPFLMPEMNELVGVDDVDGFAHKDNFYHTLEVVDNVAEVSDNIWLRLAALWHDIGKPKTKRFTKGKGWSFHGHDDVGARMIPGVFKTYKLPLDPMKYVQKLVKLHLRPIALVKDTITDTAIRRVLFEAGDDIDDLMILCRADITTKSYARKAKYWTNYDRVLKRMQEVEEKDRLRNWQPPVSGNDIMTMFGLKPSKQVGMIKKAVEDAILEGQIPNEREAAVTFLKSTFSHLI